MTDTFFPDLHLRKKKTNVRRVGYTFLFLFGQPYWTALLLGTGIVLIAVLFHGWAAGYLARAGYSSRETVLTVRGPYRHNRNPYYLSHLLMDLGFFTAAGLVEFYPLYFPFIFSVYSMWVSKEEKFLQKEFGEYKKMMDEVPRWGIRLTPAPSRGYEEHFTWKDYFINDEFKRTLCHLFLIGLLWDFYYLDNPFLWLSISSRLSIIVIAILWILYRDVERKNDYSKSKGFILTGISASLFTGISTMLATKSIDPKFSYFVQSIGGFILMLPLGYLFQPTRKLFKEFYDDHFKNPMTIYYELLIGIGLISGSFLIFWWMAVASLLIWAANLEVVKLSLTGV